MSNSLNEKNCKEIVNEYKDVFNGLGGLPPVCTLKMSDDAVPCVDPPRKVPFALLTD